MVNVERIPINNGFEEPDEFNSRFQKLKEAETKESVRQARLSLKLVNMSPSQFFSWLTKEVEKENSIRGPEDQVTVQRAYELINDNFGSPEDFNLSDFLPE